MANCIVLTNGRLIDGNGGEPVDGATVIVRGTTIERVVLGDGGPTSSRHRTFDLKGQTILPGLIDAHIHAGNIEMTLDKTAALPPAVYVHRTTRNLEQDLLMGFTTVRDAAGLDAGFKAAADQGLIRSPRLFLSVSPLVKAKRSASISVAPRNSLGILPEICKGVEDTGTAVSRTLARAADQIKVFADGEVLSQQKNDPHLPGQCLFSREELSAAVAAAQKRGSYLMAHCYSPESISTCVAAGVHTIEHGNLMDDAAADLMARKHVFFVPTLAVYDLLLEAGKSAGLDDYTLDKLDQVARFGSEAVAKAQRAGVNIGSGSDAIGPFQAYKGRELRLKADILSPMAAITSATRVNAEMMGIDRHLGTIEPGKLADLIVLDRNPLKNMSIFENLSKHVVLVMKNGMIEKQLNP